MRKAMSKIKKGLVALSYQLQVEIIGDDEIRMFSD